MKKLLFVFLLMALGGNLWASDLRIIYGIRNQLPLIIDRDEILCITYTPNNQPTKVYDKEHPPADLEEVAPSVDIHLKNGTILHMIVLAMEDLARQLK